MIIFDLQEQQKSRCKKSETAFSSASVQRDHKPGRDLEFCTLTKLYKLFKLKFVPVFLVIISGYFLTFLNMLE